MTHLPNPHQRRSVRLLFSLIACLLMVPTLSADEQETWYERKTDWHGYEQLHFKVADRPAYLVVPKQPLAGNPWIWRARFPGYHAEMDVELVGKGFHLAYVDVAGLFGAPQAMEIGDKLYEKLVSEQKLAENPCLEGVSRGGLFVYNWAARHPDKVACIYCDTPVLDIRSWPGGQGRGIGSEGTWKQCLSVYGITEDQAAAFNKNPIDQVEPIAKAKIPILHIVSNSDQVVPRGENTDVLEAKLKEKGWRMEVITVEQGTEKSNGHHFDHPDPERVVKFIDEHAAVK